MGLVNSAITTVRRCAVTQASIAVRVVAVIAGLDPLSGKAVPAGCGGAVVKASIEVRVVTVITDFTLVDGAVSTSCNRAVAAAGIRGGVGVSLTIVALFGAG